MGFIASGPLVYNAAQGNMSDNMVTRIHLGKLVDQVTGIIGLLAFIIFLFNKTFIILI
jgi:hypothetical protein